MAERVAKQESLIGVQMPTGLGFNDISDIVLNNIIEYKSENAPEAKPCKASRRMTNKELFKWLAQGNGAMRWSDHPRAQLTTKFEYDESQENYPVATGIIIRGWSESEWHEPLIEVTND